MPNVINLQVLSDFKVCKEVTSNEHFIMINCIMTIGNNLDFCFRKRAKIYYNVVIALPYLLFLLWCSKSNLDLVESLLVNYVCFSYGEMLFMRKKSQFNSLKFYLILLGDIFFPNFCSKIFI